MTEYIEREAISEEIRKYYYKNPPNSSYGEGFDRGLDRAQRAILDAPAADVSPVVHGRWTAQCVVETDGGWELEDMPYNEYQHSNPICSVCRKTALLDGGEDYVTSPYCPNCGARMDEVE